VHDKAAEGAHASTEDAGPAPEVSE
jgi:hypothetical protein